MAINELISRLKTDRRARFLIAGGLAASVNWLVRFPLNWIMPYEAAVIAATAIGMVFGFALYQSWVFGGSERRLVHQIRDFVLVNLLSMVVTAAIAILGRDLLLAMGVATALAEALSHAIGIAAGAVSNYFGHRHITFRNSAPYDGKPRSAGSSESLDV